VAVQSKYFSVGGVVPWAEPGVGAVATQSFAEAAYGPDGLALMRDGRTAGEALQQLLDHDERAERRQVAMVDATGAVAVHTGAGCTAAAGDRTGDGYSCQANLMLRPTVWDAMAAAFEAAAGPLPERLLAALDAAEAEGGDLRGRQSAALVVVAADARLPSWKRLVDLRVEDHLDPLGELHRLLRLHRAFADADKAEAAIEQGDLAGALTLLDASADDDNIEFMRASVLAGRGEVEAAQAIMRRLVARTPGWRLAAARYAAAGILPWQPEVVEVLTPPE
jgi:uncharacterized Ntn-hydrolase superfamily protein